MKSAEDRHWAGRGDGRPLTKERTQDFCEIYTRQNDDRYDKYIDRGRKIERTF